jgi:hypothetical protein
MRTSHWRVLSPATVLAATVLAATVLAAACGTTGVTHNDVGSRTALGCPASAPMPSPPGRLALDVVPANPVVATICQYAVGLPKTKAAGLVPRVVLRGPAAAGLAAVLESAGPVTAAARSCDRPASLLPVAQEIVFGYSTGPPKTATVAQTDCQLAVVTAGSRSGVLPSQTADDLFGYTDLRSATGPVTPDLIGLTAHAAAVAAGRDHFSVTFDAVVADPAARSGTVVFQVPPAGLADAVPGTQVGVILAAHRAPACTSGQLAVGYRGGGAGAGNDFGTLLIRDTSAQPCALAGPLVVTGLDAAGKVATASASFAVTGPAVLTPARQIDPLVGQLVLIAEYRDDPAAAGGLCEPFWVVPAAWRVVFPGGESLDVANADPANPTKLVPSGGFVTCRGELSAAQPSAVGVMP